MKNNNKKAINTLCAGHFITDIYSGYVNPIMPFLAANLNITLAASTFILSIAQMCSSLIQPVFGYISDNWRKRFFIFFGLLLASIFLPLIGLANNVYTLCACLIIGSIGNAFFHPQATSFVNIYSDIKDLTKNMSIFLALGTLGYALGPIISSSFAEFFSTKTLAFTGIVGIIIAILILIYVPRISDTPNTSSHIHFFKAVKEIFSCRAMIVLLLFSSLKSLATQSASILLPFLWKSLNYSAMSIGILLFGFLIAGVLGTITSSKLENFMGTKKVIVLSFCAILPLYIIFALTYKTIPTISMAAFILVGFFAMLSVPINMVLAHQVMPQYKSLISGFIGGFCWGVVGMCMAICGLFAQKHGIINVLIIISIFPMLLSTLVKYIPDKEC